MFKILKVSIFYTLFLASDQLIDISELQRVTSADGRVDAVLLMKSGGSTGYVRYEVHMIISGEKIVTNFDRHLLLLKTKKAQISWIKPKLLGVEYSAGSIIRSFDNEYLQYDNEDQGFRRAESYELVLDRLVYETPTKADHGI